MFIYLLLLIGCQEETIQPVQTVEPKEVAIDAPLAKQHTLGALSISLNYGIVLDVKDTSFEYIPRAFHVTIYNESDIEQDLAFLHNYTMVKYDTKAPLPAMSLNADALPTTIQPNSIVTAYLALYYPDFSNYDDELLRFTLDDQHIYLEPPEFLSYTNYYDLPVPSYNESALTKPVTSGHLPNYAYETLIRYDCPDLNQRVAICKGDEQAHTVEFTYQGRPLLFYYEQQLKQATISYGKNTLTLYFDQQQLTHAAWNDDIITITQMITICAQQVLQLSDIIEEEPATTSFTYNGMIYTDTNESKDTSDDAIGTNNKELVLPYTTNDIDQWIKDTVRPAYSAIETVINNNTLKSTTQQDKHVYSYQNFTKTVTFLQDETYSAFYLDEQLVFILHVGPNRALTRYYFKDDQLLRILHADETTEQYDTTTQLDSYLQLEHQLKEIVQ